MAFLSAKSTVYFVVIDEKTAFAADAPIIWIDRNE
jgi:hypothetical protein